MNNYNYKFIKRVTLAIVLLLCIMSLVGCGGSEKKDKKRVVIYTTSSDFQISFMQEDMKKKFPDYDVVFDYKTTGEHFNILKQNKNTIECDISSDLEYALLDILVKDGVFANIENITDKEKYADDLKASNYYVPSLRSGGAIIVNTEVLKEKGIKKPTSYRDLLKPEYKGLISMPNPKSSGTGYMFLLNLCNAWGEDEAFEYFDKLKANIHSFSASGSGPVNELKMKEIAVAFGITADAVQKINKDKAPFEIIFFEEGSPYSFYGHAVIKGKETKPEVLEVYKYLINEISEKNNIICYPEKLYKKDIQHQIKNFPTNIKYGDMSNMTAERKAALLKRWKY